MPKRGKVGFSGIAMPVAAGADAAPIKNPQTTLDINLGRRRFPVVGMSSLVSTGWKIEDPKEAMIYLLTVHWKKAGG